jgi:hypothetical protein
MKPIAGPYKTNDRDDPSEAVVISRLSEHQYRVENPRQWEGVGIFDGTLYRGVFRYKDTMAYEPFRGRWGMHDAVLRGDGSFAVHGRFMAGDDDEFGDDEFDVIWVPERRHG